MRFKVPFDNGKIVAKKGDDVPASVPAEKRALWKRQGLIEDKPVAPKPVAKPAAKPVKAKLAK